MNAMVKDSAPTVESTSGLVRYDTMRKALRAAAEVDEVKDIHDKAIALAAYAKQANDAQALRWWTEVRARAARRAGELLAADPPKRGPKDNSSHLERNYTYQQATDWRKLAAIPEPEFENALTEQLDGIGHVSTGLILRAERRKQVAEKINSLRERETSAPTGTYDVIVIDPPWPIEKIERDVAPEQVAFPYPTMTVEDIKAMTLPMAGNCHVWLWTTHKFLPTAFECLSAWGVKYVCTFVWHKPGAFQPFGLPQYNCEFALYARRGAPVFVDLKDFPVCFSAPRGKHSEKPETFYEVVRRVTGGKRLDIFNRRAIEGFDAWGNEA